MDNIDFSNESYDNYSKNNGNIIKNLNNYKISIKKTKVKNCPNCNCDIRKDYTYCKICGTNLQDAYIKGSANNLNKEFNFKYIVNYLNLKNSFLISLVAILILLAVSSIIRVLFKVSSSSLGNIINPIHILLGLNSGTVNIYSSSMMGWQSTKLNLGLIGFVILPVLSIIISNLIFNKKKHENSNDVLRNSLGVGICYGLTLLILSILSETSLGYSYNTMQYSQMTQFKFSALNMMIKGFIIGFLPTFYLLYKKEYNDENIYLSIFKKGINLILVGYLTTLAILIILTLVDKSFLDGLGVSTYINSYGNIITLSQLAMYIWLFGNFIPVGIGGGYFSLFNILTSSSYLTTTLVLISMFFLSSLIIIIFACNLEGRYKDRYGLKPILILSISYALLMGLISILTKLTLGGSVDILSLSSYSSYISMGASLISSILISFIYSFLVSLVGYKLNIFN